VEDAVSQCLERRRSTFDLRLQIFGYSYLKVQGQRRDPTNTQSFPSKESPSARMSHSADPSASCFIRSLTCRGSLSAAVIMRDTISSGLCVSGVIPAKTPRYSFSSIVHRIRDPSILTSLVPYQGTIDIDSWGIAFRFRVGRMFCSRDLYNGPLKDRLRNVSARSSAVTRSRYWSLLG
jgi:hypothetical protein